MRAGGMVAPGNATFDRELYPIPACRPMSITSFYRIQV